MFEKLLIDYWRSDTSTHTLAYMVSCQRTLVSQLNTYDGSSFALEGWFVFHGSDLGNARQCSAESGQSTSGALLEMKK